MPLHPAAQPETIYRRFFVAGILIVLTAGAAWGALLLWQVARAGSFTGVSIHLVNAHGHAQIFGWVGLFIMGFAYQVLPRIWGMRPPRVVAPHLAVTAFVLMIVGIVLSTIGISDAAGASNYAAPIVIIGGLVQIAAVTTFAGQIAVTFRRSPEPISPAIGFMFMAIVFFIAMTVMSLWHMLALVQAASHEAMLAQIATYQAALRDLQIHGLAMFMILGVSMRFFPAPGMFGLSRTPASLGWLGLFILTLAVIGEVTLLIASQHTGPPTSQALATMLIAPWLMLLLGVGIIVLPWCLWRPLPTVHRSTKFIRTAYLWLGISILMLLAMPAYMAMRDMVFSHAYYGAVRHAITVGFVSLMIMGVTAKVVPSLRGFDESGLTWLWGPFIFVNVGCFLRVSMQVLTDWHDAFFSLIAVSGALELAGLAWWGIGLLSIMLWRAPVSGPTDRTPSPGALMRRESCSCCAMPSSMNS